MIVQLDGAPVFIATGGQPFDATKPAIVFIHGAGMDHSVWALQTRWFAHHGWSVLAVDLPAHGSSGGAPLGSINAMAAWLARLLARLGMAQASLVGHSMGTLIAIETAVQHPALVRSLGLVATAATMGVHPAMLEAAAINDHAAIDMVAIWGTGPRAMLGGAKAPGQWMLGEALRVLERCPPVSLHADLAACNDAGDMRERAGAITCPVVLVLGAADQMTTAKGGYALAGAIPQARTLVVPQAGHMLMLDAPDAVLDALIAHL